MTVLALHKNADNEFRVRVMEAAAAKGKPIRDLTAAERDEVAREAGTAMSDAGNEALRIDAIVKAMDIELGRRIFEEMVRQQVPDDAPVPIFMGCVHAAIGRYRQQDAVKALDAYLVEQERVLREGPDEDPAIDPDHLRQVVDMAIAKVRARL